ncbi:MAG: PAS domain-containing protein, partial [Aliarcobacter sp.]|nr:PAS domain-containing protein [Aliarcobacter sp.]
LKYKEDLEGQILENQKQKETLLRAQKVAHIGDWKLDINTNKVFWSNEVIRILGMQNKNKDDFGVELLKNVVIEEDISNLVNSLNACINTGAEHKVIYRIKKPNNEIRWIDCRGELDEDKLSIIGYRPTKGFFFQQYLN